MYQNNVFRKFAPKNTSSLKKKMNRSTLEMFA